MLIYNETDFSLYVAQTDLASTNAKSVLPHKESIDDRFLWYQTVSAKQSVYYTPPAVNETFPEIHNAEFGIVFACVSADNIKWSQPIKVDENKKIVINVPSFGGLKLCINTLNKTAEITINYLENINGAEEPMLNPSILVDNFESPSTKSITKSHHKKTYLLSTISKKQKLNLRIFSKGISLTLLRDGEQSNVHVVSFNIGEIQLEYVNKVNIKNKNMK